MANELADLKTEVQENKDLVQSAKALLTGIKTKLDEAIASGNMSEVKALSDELAVSNDELSAAIVANTPAEE